MPLDPINYASIDDPKISVIVAVYNRASDLERCIDGVSRQTYSNTELIIIDGGSTDGTVDILRKHSDKIAFWQSETDNGIYDAWNKALDHVTGDWICFLGSDDSFMSDDVVERMVPYLRLAAPSVRVVYGKNAVVSKHGEIVDYYGTPWPEAKKGLLHTLTIPHPGTMHHRTLFEDHGRFDTSLRITGDHDLLLRELMTGEALFVSDIVMVGFGHEGVSNSPKMMSQMLSELKRVYRKHSIKHPFYRRYSRVTLKMTLTGWTYRLIGERGFRVVADSIRRLRGRPTVWR